jgi:hypothetical protein
MSDLLTERRIVEKRSRVGIREGVLFSALGVAVSDVCELK